MLYNSEIGKLSGSGLNWKMLLTAYTF